MPYNKQDIEPISKQLTIVIGLTVVGFMAFGLALSFYRNILFENTLKEIADQNKQLAAHIDEGYSDLAYYQSDQYKDKFAKENMDKLNPGEKLVIITQPVKSDDIVDTVTQKERQEAAYYELLQQMPVWDHWKLYLFQRDKIDKLKNAL